MLSFIKLENMLEEKKLNKYFLRKNGINSTQLDKMLKTGDCGGKTINRICELLDCQPSDIMEYIPDEEDRNAICDMDKKGIKNLKEELKQIKKEDGKLD